jgi:hypothetical protein
MNDEFLKYVIFAILYIQILSFIFNPKIKVQMLICVLVLTAIASVSFVIDMHKGIGEPNAKLNSFKDGIIGSFVKLLPQTIQDQTQSAPIGWFVGFIGLMNLIAIMFVTKIEYESTKKLSNKNEKKLKSVKGVFISIVVSVILIALISYFIFNKNITISSAFGPSVILSKLTWLNGIDLSKIIGNTNALGFLSTYVFFASVYTLDTSRKLHKLFVNNLIAK